jgi:hypothetical protein
MRQLLGDGKRSSVVGQKLERVDPAEVGAFYEREMPRLVVFVTIGIGLGTHALLCMDLRASISGHRRQRWLGATRREGDERTLMLSYPHHPRQRAAQPRRAPSSAARINRSPRPAQSASRQLKWTHGA